VKKKRSSKARPQRTFTDEVTGQVNRLMSGQMTEQFQLMERRINENLKHTLQFYAFKVTVLEDILMDKLDITEDQLNDELLTKEDQMYGFVAVTRPIEKGDMIRLKFYDLNAESKEPQLLKINELCSEKPELNKDFEAELIGLKTGDEKEITVFLPTKNPEGHKVQKGFRYHTTITRVSTPLKPLEEKNEEKSTDSEGSDSVSEGKDTKSAEADGSTEQS